MFISKANRILSFVMVLLLMATIPSIAEDVASEPFENQVEEVEFFLGMDSISEDEAISMTQDLIEDEVFEDATGEDENIEATDDYYGLFSTSSNPQTLFYWNDTVTYKVKQQFNLKSEPYSNSNNMGTAKKGSSLTFTKFVVNGYYNLWGATSDNKYAYLGLKVKNGSWSTDGTQYFNSVVKPANSQIKFSGIAYPSSYKINPSGYYLSDGTVSSIYPFKSIKSEISKNNGNVISTYTRSISGTVYAVKNLDTMSSSDNGVHFSWIKDPGTYYWKLTATDLTGYSQTCTMQFTAYTNSNTTSQTTPTEVFPTSVSLSKTNVAMRVGETYKLTATVYPSNATNKSVTWSTNDLSVATVSEGTVTAKGVGTAQIMVVTHNTKIAVATVQVSAATEKVSPTVVNPTSITLNIEKIELIEGGYLQLKPVISPSNATNKTVSYQSNNDSVARVDKSGKVTAVKEGKCKIKASTANGKEAVVSIEVKKAQKPSKVSLNYSGTQKLSIKEKLQLKAYLSPSGATSTITWESSKTSVATVNSNGIVTPIKVGKTTITAKTVNGKKAKVTVEVFDPEDATKVYFDLAMKVSDFLSKIGGNQITVGQRFQVVAYCEPSTAKIVKYTSSNPKVATVNSAGWVTTLSKGTTKIYAYSKNGKYAYYKIKVK